MGCHWYELRPDPASASRLTIAQIIAALSRARRRNVADKAARIQAVLRAEHLGQPEVVTQAYAATTRAAVAVLRTLDEQVKVLQGQVDAHFGQHPDAEIICSQPGLGPVLGARVLAEFGDDPTATPTRNPAKTTPAPARSPAPRAKRRSCSPGLCTTTGSSTPS